MIYFHRFWAEMQELEVYKVPSQHYFKRAGGGFNFANVLGLNPLRILWLRILIRGSGFSCTGLRLCKNSENS